MLVDDFQSAIQNLRLNKGRTILSLLGIIIGALCVVSITTLGSSLKESIKGTFATMNNKIIQVSSRLNPSESKLKLDDNFRNELLNAVPNIKEIHLTQLFHANMVTEHYARHGHEITAVEYGYLKNQGVEFHSGSDFSPGCYKEGRHQIIIGEEIAKQLFPTEDALGKKLWLYITNSNSYDSFSLLPKLFEVKGILKAQDTLTSNAAYLIIIPRSILVNEELAGNDSFTYFHVIATEDEYVTKVKNTLLSYTDNKTGITDSLYAMSLEEIIQSILESLNAVSLVLVAIAGLSMLVGGIGIMNIMIVTVTERRQEIGIRKAIGASKVDILMQFLVEAVSITITGSLIGTILGLLTSYFLMSFASMSVSNNSGEIVFAPDISSILISNIISCLVGVFFGLYPAMQAANLNAVKALEET